MADRFSVIAADPPWHYNSRAHHKTRFRGGACGHYSLMKTADLCRLPIADYAEERCMLFLWATFPNLRDAFQVIEAWGFRYATNAFTWVKTNPKSGTPFFGVGYYTKSNAEVCLLATRGRPIRPAVNTVSSVIIAPRGEHSAKPEEARLRIDRMYPTERKLELFARRPVEGWTCWGDHLGVRLTANGAEHAGGVQDAARPLLLPEAAQPALPFAA